MDARMVSRDECGNIPQGGLPSRGPFLILPETNQKAMGDHKEAEQNEIGGPVVFALILFAIVILSIYLMV